MITEATSAAGVVGRSAEVETLGRSKGGLTTRIHAITDALGNLLDFYIDSVGKPAISGS